MACGLGEPPFDGQLLRAISPWGIAILARESILWGNEFRTPEIAEKDIRRMFELFNSVNSGKSAPTSEYLHGAMLRYADEQCPYQESSFEEVSRTQVLLIDGAEEIATEVIDAQFWHALLGAPLPQVVGATFLLSVGAFQNNGNFSLDWLNRPDLSALTQAWPLEAIERTVARISGTSEDFKAAWDAAPSPSEGLERWAFNPLTVMPFLRQPDGQFLAPVPQLILRTVTPANLYYPAIKVGGQAFGRDLGHLTEHYVGKQLKSMSGSQVHPEVAFKVGRDNKKSIDWFVIFDDLVLLIEVKSARFGLLARTGDTGFEDTLRVTIDKAVKQIERTNEALDASTAAFEHIPTDRPRIGIVVTVEPFYLANSTWTRDLLHTPKLPILVASLREVEYMVSLDPSAVALQLKKIVADIDLSTWALHDALRGLPQVNDNPVLQAAWDAYPWPDFDSVEGLSGSL